MVILNGTAYEPGAPEVSLLNRSFKYGDGLFETMRVYQGQLLFWERHWQRLRWGMEQLGFAFEAEAYRQRLALDMERAMQLNALQGHGRLRLHVYRSGEGAYAPLSDEPYHLIEAYALKQDPYQEPAELSLGVYPDWSLQHDPLSGCKTANALPYVLAARYARQQGWDEALLLSPEGLAEASAANLFVIQQRKLYTPPLSTGCLPGVMRAVVMQLAAQTKIPCHERKLKPRDLRSAEEIFLTNSIRGLQPVARVDGRKTPLREHALTTFLQNCLIQLVQD